MLEATGKRLVDREDLEQSVGHEGTARSTMLGAKGESTLTGIILFNQLA